MRNRPPPEFFALVKTLVAADEGRGLTVDDVATAMGVHRSRLYRYLNETDGPSGSTLAAMADYWGMTMDDVWHGRTPINAGTRAAAALSEVLRDVPAPGPPPGVGERRRVNRRATDMPPP